MTGVKIIDAKNFDAWYWCKKYKHAVAPEIYDMVLHWLETNKTG